MKHIARNLRRKQTDAERLLGASLRVRRLLGFKFRRQEGLLGPYVVDFACLGPKLVIEVDGGQHAEQAAAGRCEDRGSGSPGVSGHPVLQR